MRRVRTAAAVTAAVLLAGCGASASRLTTGAAPAPASATAPALLMAQAEASLAERDAPAAVSFAELAVRAEPADVVARRALVRYYLAAGRFRAAADACDDLLAIRSDDADARLKLGVALLAEGRTAAGLAAIEASGAPVADRGLALALAGEAHRAAVLLDEAARTPAADARLRQNLALAHALAGRWAQARVVAAQDLPAPEVDARIRAWAGLASGDAATRTRAFLAVQLAPSDPGRPVELAYHLPTAAQPQKLAAARTAAPEPAVTSPLTVQPVAAADGSARAVVHRVAVPERPRDGGGGSWVVQLGAFPNGAARNAGWQRLRQDNSTLRGLVPLLTDTVLRQARLQRLAVGGFELRPALDLCKSLRAAGETCYVRRRELAETGGPVRLASR